jgi:hypothetical protein
MRPDTRIVLFYREGHQNIVLFDNEENVILEKIRQESFLIDRDQEVGRLHRAHRQLVRVIMLFVF